LLGGRETSKKLPKHFEDERKNVEPWDFWARNDSGSGPSW